MGARASREAEQPSDEGDRQTDTAVRINSPHHLTSVPSLTVLPCSYPLVLENYLCFSFKTAATSPPKQLFLQPPVKGTSGFPRACNFPELSPGLVLQAPRPLILTTPPAGDWSIHLPAEETHWNRPTPCGQEGAELLSVLWALRFKDLGS